MKHTSLAIARTRLSMEKFSLLKMACGVFVFCVVAAVPSSAQIIYTTLVNFNGTNGGVPTAALIQATDGNFYGTTSTGGANNQGTVFKITPRGTLTTLYSFCALTNCADGASPAAGLVQGPDGNLYGTTSVDGVNGLGGTVFKITPRGTLTTLHSFCAVTSCADGFAPNAGLIQGTDGNFYGTARAGGSSDYGTIFKITPAGKLTTLHSFDNTDGAYPEAALVQVPDGDFYGTTSEYGAYGGGTVFRFSAITGKLTTLHSFCALSRCADGYRSFSALVRGTDGNFHGTTQGGGPNGGGTVFKITPRGTRTTIYSFCALTSCADGFAPNAGLIQGTDGNYYGTTSNGNKYCPAGTTPFCGTTFKITPRGTLTTLHNFCALTNCADGGGPNAALLQGTDGSFYGTNTGGGTSNNCTYGCGTIFKLSVGLRPFVTPQTDVGRVGAKVIILGTDLTGASRVSFNGKTATFTVVSASEITATVPAGATTGKIEVTTPSGTLTSNTAFYVTPQVRSFTPASGPVGTQVKITGVSLTQTAGVTFGGVTATAFIVDSDTQVTATVPTGAVTGRVSLSTPGGDAWSATNFTVQ